LIVAEGFFGEIVTGNRICPGAAAAADIDVLTAATRAFIGLKIPQLLEELAVFPDIL
jgi:hypothetical protein